jgi:hypothetical protein
MRGLGDDIQSEDQSDSRPGIMWSVPFVSIRSLCVQVLKDKTIEGVR